MPLPNDGNPTGYCDRDGVAICFGDFVSDFLGPDVPEHPYNYENQGVVVGLSDLPPHHVKVVFVATKDNSPCMRKPEKLYHP